jgi:hypothetical protein
MRRHKHIRPKRLIVEPPIVAGSNSSPDSTDSDSSSYVCKTEKLNVCNTSRAITPNQPKTPYFYRSRESFLESQNEQEEFNERMSSDKIYHHTCERHKFDGLFNLAIIMLCFSCLGMSLDNVLKKGVLVDLELLLCMTGEVQRSYILFAILGGYVGFTFLLSQIFMYIIYQGKVSDSNGNKIREKNGNHVRKRQILYYLCAAIYVTAMFTSFYLIVTMIFSMRLSLRKCNSMNIY